MSLDIFNLLVGTLLSFKAAQGELYFFGSAVYIALFANEDYLGMTPQAIRPLPPPFSGLSL
jgi:hypothetical protein